MPNKSKKLAEFFTKDSKSASKIASNSSTELFAAIRTGNIKKVKEILKNSDLKIGPFRSNGMKSESGYKSHLVEAIQRGYEDIALELINHGIMINFVDDNGNFPLKMAVDREMDKVVDVLIAARNKEGRSILDLSYRVFEENPKFIKVLLKRSIVNNDLPLLTYMEHFINDNDDDTLNDFIASAISRGNFRAARILINNAGNLIVYLKPLMSGYDEDRIRPDESGPFRELRDLANDADELNEMLYNNKIIGAKNLTAADVYHIETLITAAGENKKAFDYIDIAKNRSLPERVLIHTNPNDRNVINEVSRIFSDLINRETVFRSDYKGRTLLTIGMEKLAKNNNFRPIVNQIVEAMEKFKPGSAQKELQKNPSLLNDKKGEVKKRSDQRADSDPKRNVKMGRGKSLYQPVDKVKKY